MVVDRYFAKETLSVLASVLSVLVIIFASKHFVRYMSDAAAGELPTYLILKLLSLFTLASLVLMLPFAIFMAVVMALGRMYRDSEVVALEACGVGTPRIIQAAGLLGAGVALVVAVLSLGVAPWAEKQQYALRDVALAESEYSLIEGGRFHEIRDGQGIFYVERTSDDGRRMENVFVRIMENGKLDVFTAKSGFQRVDAETGARYIVLENGYRYEELANHAGFRVHEYRESGIRIEQQVISRNVDPIVARSSWALLSSDDPRELAEFHWRLGMPISSLILAIIAVPLAKARPRQGRYAKLVIGLLVYIAYTYSLMLGRSWLEKGVIPPMMGLWWAHAAALLLFAALLVRQFGWRWSWRTMLGR